VNNSRVLIVGGGHNGLVCATYLAKAGFGVTVLERRELFGGSCVTEELWPGYKISRAAYVLSLFRPQIARDLELARHGLELLPRTPSSFTPLPDGRSLVLGADRAENLAEIQRFSSADARAFPRFEDLLGRVAAAIEPTLDYPAPELPIRSLRDLRSLLSLLRAGWKLRADLPDAMRLLLGPARSLLEEYFESEPLLATLATDAVIGANASPSMPGTGYVLFHHVMGSITGERGVWAYVRGGMGGLSNALASSARAAGVELRSDAEVQTIRCRAGRATGVVLTSGEELQADAIVCSTDPRRSFSLLDGEAQLPDEFVRALATIDYRSPVVKLNLALREAPRFRVTDRQNAPLTGTIHVGACDLDAIEDAYSDAQAGRVSARPLIELTLPSSVDQTLAPEGHMVASVFAQYAPALDKDDLRWPELRDQMRDRVFAAIEEVAPGFTSSVEHVEVLAAPDLEDIFGLTGGNIFHGAMTPDRLLFMRPVPHWARHHTPVDGLYLCGSACHPGGGVVGAPGRNAALEISTALRRESR
jgi:phytoene dehydrogenase-like protein